MSKLQFRKIKALFKKCQIRLMPKTRRAVLKRRASRLALMTWNKANSFKSFSNHSNHLNPIIQNLQWESLTKPIDKTWMALFPMMLSVYLKMQILQFCLKELVRRQEIMWNSHTYKEVSKDWLKTHLRRLEKTHRLVCTQQLRQSQCYHQTCEIQNS